ncbi:FeoA family protein [Methanolacinia petrolearia DSM 11571]|uniref:FeoA family protein n=1 Tax=Methanolacinia petrolearia (strain DSM 11571 / OCM 486 / SEBR 4847) TaxID=679926 RepID=E1RFC4_METP4|nr:FeoA family protein [Methanolacinia petrolearia]ADN35072.1 FeoA family protein [Methanolacinia petrolearia DSM 11571]
MKKKLSEMDFGDYGTVCEISSNKSGLRALGVREGKTLTMVTKQPVKGPVVVMLGEVEVAMGLEMADSVFVECS